MLLTISKTDIHALTQFSAKWDRKGEKTWLHLYFKLANFGTMFANILKMLRLTKFLICKPFERGFTLHVWAWFHSSLYRTQNWYVNSIWDVKANSLCSTLNAVSVFHFCLFACKKKNLQCTYLDEYCCIYEEWFREN